MNQENRASFDFSLEWKSSFAKHQDVFHLENVDYKLDVFPNDFGEKISKLDVNKSYSETFPAETLIEDTYSASRVKNFDAKLFNQHFKQQFTHPQLYRFYPTTIAWQALGSFAGDMTPFRLISINDDNMKADCNHPLSKYHLSLTATKTKENETNVNNQVISKSHHIGELITQKGPGMQAPFEFGDPVFFDDYPFKRNDENDDALFYSIPRITHHIDARATSEITKLYSELLTPDTQVLDLMSSWISHLPQRMSFKKVVGLGMNEEELKTNAQLDEYNVHDLNRDSKLPYDDNSFDHAICTVSIEYLTHPIEIMKELARVVRPGGKFVATFSGRWFPPKAINIWSQLHPFERMQLVLEYFRQSGKFEDLHTFSKRGLPRPNDDKYIGKTKISDPVFAVWGTCKEAE